MKQSKFIKKQSKKFDSIHEKKFKKILEIYDDFAGRHVDHDLWDISVDIVNDEITKIRPIYKKLQHKLKRAEINADGDAEQIDALRERCHKMEVSHRERCCQSEQEKNVLMAHCDMLEKQTRAAEKALSKAWARESDCADFTAKIVSNLVRNNE